MVATFPLAQSALADLLRIRSVVWNLERYVETSGVEGEDIEAELRSPLWVGEVESVPMELAEANQLYARFLLLDGGMQSFYLHNPLAPYPQADPDGSIIGSDTVQIHTVGVDNKTLRLKGLPAGYVLTIGDYIAVTYNTSRRALYIVCETVTADGSGNTPSFEVRGYLRPGTAVNNVVDLKKPAAKVKLVDGTLRVEPLSTVHSVIRFTARQTLRAS
jgi:hypothetical protein